MSQLHGNYSLLWLSLENVSSESQLLPLCWFTHKSNIRKLAAMWVKKGIVDQKNIILVLCFSDCKKMVAADYAVDAKLSELLWEKSIEMTQLQPEEIVVTNNRKWKNCNVNFRGLSYRYYRRNKTAIWTSDRRTALWKESWVKLQYVHARIIIANVWEMS